MPNVSKPSGLTPVKYLNGADWDGRGQMYYIGTGDGSVFTVGDLVKLSGDGDATRGIPGISKSAAGDTSVGVVVAIGTNPDGGPYINPSDLTLTAAPATKTVPYYVLVVDDPNVIFEIQESGTALTSADIGINANILVANPATGVKVSGSMIDNSTKNTTATLNFKLLGLVRRADNAFGTSAKWLVVINNHTFRTGVLGV